MEPITLTEAKKFIREDEDYEYNDDLLSLLITAERKAMELQLGILLVEREVNDYYRKPCCGNVSRTCFELRYVPVQGDVVIKDLQGNVVTFDNKGTPEYPAYNFSYSTNLTYTAGYPDGEVPEDLKLALQMRVATAYMQRENFTDATVNEVTNNSRQLERPHSRNVF